MWAQMMFLFLSALGTPSPLYKENCSAHYSSNSVETFVQREQMIIVLFFMYERNFLKIIVPK